MSLTIEFLSIKINYDDIVFYLTLFQKVVIIVMKQTEYIKWCFYEE